MNQKKIWLVEDEEDILALVYYNLVKEGHKVRGFSCGEDMLAALDTDLPDLFLLDVMLPGIDGLALCKKIKADTRVSSVPVIMLTSKGEEGDIVAGFNQGADDYIPKPFSPKVLTARVRAIFRRRAKEPDQATEVVSHGPLAIDLGRYEAWFAGEPLLLTATEFKILSLLASQPGRVFSRDQIINGVHDGYTAVTDRTVDVQIAGLRKKLGAGQKCIETVRGIGYKLKL